MNLDKELEKFNEGQRAAIESKLDENILISAGAGSGKTKTLSFKVYKLVAVDGIKPSELLVLTFTNKAAFEMKQRIISQFKSHSDGNDKLCQEIVSSHIQTFDSFSLYLVKKYCSLLKLPDNIQIADDSILTTKKNEILDEVLKEYYLNDRDRIIQSFSKFCTTDSKIIKNIVFYIDDELNKILPSKKEKFIKNYDSNFMNQEFIDKIYDNYVQSLKENLLATCKSIYFDYKTNEHKNDLDYMAKALNNPSNFDFNKYLYFNDEPSSEIVQILFDILETDNEHFFEKIAYYVQSEAFDGRKRKAKKGNKTEHDAIYTPIRDAIKEGIYEKTIERFGSTKSELLNNILSFKDDIHLFFEIIEKMNEKLEQYKIQTNAFTFSDIGYKALSLLVDEKYKQAGDEIKNRFKYILVDEYQDTNDIQETFLNSLAAKSTLFCVGDAKQSIYRFRNANVQLFMDRKEKYEKDPKSGRVIDMNWNYRSSFELLANINSIFEGYMTLNHGGIDYSETKVNKEGNVIKPQSLDHDPKVKKTKDPNSFYGLGLINYHAPESCDLTPLELEARTIIRDIKTKVDHGYQVVDENGFLRPCKYSDFAILMKVKKGFQDYQQIFEEAGIPVNVQTEDHLTQINAILLLQSLIKFINAELHILKKEQPKENMLHLFLSIARSYIYGKDAGYDDNKLNEIIMNKDSYKNDKICDDVFKFAKEHVDSPLTVIFLDMIKDFGILDKLPAVGDVVSNINKIESFYQIVVAQEHLGQGIEDFVKLFKNISKYSIDLASEIDVEIENAVKIMSIHASKGLEFPIVYMPVTYNKITGRAMDGKSAIISQNYGLMLPNYKLNENVVSLFTQTYLETEGSRDEDINEHVRVFYVALTRAKEALYIVGNPKKKSRNQKANPEDLYEMLRYITHVPVLTPEGYDLLCKKGIIDDAGKVTLLTLTNKYKEFCSTRPSINNLNDLDKRVVLNKFNDIKKNFENIIAGQIDGYKNDLLAYYRNRLDKIDDDKKAELLSIVLFGNYSTKTKAAFFEKYFKVGEREDNFEDEISDFNIYIPNIDESTDEDDYDEDELYLEEVKKLSDDEFFTQLFEVARNYPTLSTYVKVIDGIECDLSDIEYDPTVIKKSLVIFDASELGDEEVVVENKEAPEGEENPYIVIDKKEYKDLDIVPNDKEIVFEKKIVNKGRASKVFNADEDLDKINALNYGTLLHSYLEIVDFKTKDTSFITNNKDKALIDSVLSLDIFNNLDNSTIYHEYSYFDPELNTTGSIDLLIIGKDNAIIIDYKTKNIEDKAYTKQLNTYRRNVQRLFKINNIEMYLLSIVDHKLQEVERQD